MSIIDTFDDISEEVISPSDIAERIDGFPKTVLVTFNMKTLEMAKEFFHGVEISVMNACVNVPVYKIQYKGRSFGIYMTVLGGAASVGLMEEIIAKGAEKIVVYGSAGVLDKNLAAGHVIVPTEAYRDEGTSYHYMSAGDYVKINTAGRLGEILDEIGIPYVFGKTWTTDGFYRETRKNMEKRKKDGCIAVEMECASLMAASQFRKIELYQFLYAADSLDGEAWDARILGHMPANAKEQYLRIALETCMRV